MFLFLLLAVKIIRGYQYSILPNSQTSLEEFADYSTTLFFPLMPQDDLIHFVYFNKLIFIFSWKDDAA